MPTTKPTNNPEGKCELCGEVLTRRKAAAHLKKCRAAHPLAEGKKSAEIYTLAITAPFSEFFLFVEMGANQKLAALDQFLRDIWLECCGHGSTFIIDGVNYDSNTDYVFVDDEFKGNQSMNCKIGSVVGEKDVFEYEYDFGTTSYVKIAVAGIRETKEEPPKKPVLLMRNLEPKWACCVCGKPATIVDNNGLGLAPDNVYCETCAESKLEEYARSEIKNSPRSGLCGY